MEKLFQGWNVNDSNWNNLSWKMMIYNVEGNIIE